MKTINKDIRKIFKDDLKRQQRASRSANLLYLQKLEEERASYVPPVKLYVVDTVNYQGYVQTIMTDGVHSDYKGLTIEELRERDNNPNYQALTWEELEPIDKQYEQSLCKEFVEITEEQYWEWLECVPPKRHNPNIWFFVGECYSHTLHQFCFEYNGHYFTALRSVNTLSEELHRQIDEYITAHHFYLKIACQMEGTFHLENNMLEIHHNHKKIFIEQVKDRCNYWSSLKADGVQYGINIHETEWRSEITYQLYLYPMMDDKPLCEKYASIKLAVLRAGD